MRGIDSPTIEAMASLISPRLMDSEKLNIDYFQRYTRHSRGTLRMIKLVLFASCVLCCTLVITFGKQSDWNLVHSSHTSSSTTDTYKSGKSFSKTGSETAADVNLMKSSRPIYYTIHTNELYDINIAIKNILDLVPDEIHIRDLTEPIKAGGEEKLHEVGLRVRMFKKYFDAWEALHVVTDSLSNTAFVRDDVFRHIRDTDDISSFTKKSRAEALRQYEIYRKFLSDMSTILFPWTAPYFSDHMTLHGHMYNAGRGIVISGNDDQALFILTAIKSFRSMGCDLPVEVMYLGENDLNQDFRERLEELHDVTTRDLTQMVDDQGWELQGWAGKAFAAFMSSFREVILLDADVLFFDNPALLFEEPGYQETGALFFKDRIVWPESKQSFLRKIMPKPISKHVTESVWWTGESSEYQEGGVVVVDKWRHFLSIFLTARLNGPDRLDTSEGQGTYSMWWGDKETWWIGFELAGDSDYHFHQGDTANMGLVSNVVLKNGSEVDSENFLKAPSRAHVIAEEGPIKMNVLNIGGKKEENASGTPSSESSREGPKQETESTEASKSKSAIQLDEPPVSNAVQEEPDTISRRHLTRRDEYFNPPNTNALPTSSLLTLQETHNYILCSPQLLHLTTSGRPMWFNGWIQQNKRDPSSQISTFEVFVSARMRDGSAAKWTVGGNNVACLKGDGLGVFEERERKVLDGVEGFARGVGAVGRSQ